MLTEITYPCKFDSSRQPAFILKSSSTEPRPLVVTLHTWSYTYEGPDPKYEEFARLHDWNMIYPHFRGPNWTTEA